MATVYVLHLETLGSYYTGSCKDLESRIQEHNNRRFKNSFTAKATD